MFWPWLSVDSVRPSRFMPPFCPWTDCIAHRGEGRGFNRNGWYRKPSSRRRIPRFLCLECGGSCSRATFSTSYYLKRPALLPAVARGSRPARAHRQIARSNHCSKTTVTRMAERLGRHAILFHARCLASLRLHPRGRGPRSLRNVCGTTGSSFRDRDGRRLTVVVRLRHRSRPHRGSGRRPDRTPDQSKTSASNSSYVKSIKRTFRGLMSHSTEDNRLTCIVDGRNDYRVAARAVDLRSSHHPARLSESQARAQGSAPIPGSQRPGSRDVPGGSAPPAASPHLRGPQARDDRLRTSDRVDHRTCSSHGCLEELHQGTIGATSRPDDPGDEGGIDGFPMAMGAAAVPETVSRAQSV